MNWFINRSIAAKIVICFCTVIAIGAAAGVATWRSLALVEDTQDWTTHTYQVLDVKNALLTSVLRQDGDLRGYLLTHDRKFLERANAQNQELQAALLHIKTLTSDNASQQRRIEALAPLIDAWRMHMPVVPTDAPLDEHDSVGRTAVLGSDHVLAPIFRSLDAIGAEEDRLMAIRKRARADALASGYWTNAIGPCLALTVAIMLGWGLRGLIAVPIGRLAVAMRRLAGGELEVALPDTTGRDEIGEMGRAVEVFKADLVEAKRLRKEQQDTRLRARREREAFLASMADRFEQVVGGVVQSVSTSTAQMETSAQALLEGAEWTSAQVTSVAGSTKQASVTMEAVAGETEALLDSVGEINVRMSQSLKIAEQAVAEADRTTATIEGLAQSAKRIGVIVDLINDVARQTNMLALNATIEAARAGEAGRGFAVVATEVKGLADQTATATDDIRGQIEGIRSAAAGSMVAITQIGRTIRDLAHATAEITQAGGVQGDATRDMVRGTQATAQATAHVLAQLERVSEGAVTTGAAATKVLSAAQTLAQQSSLLNEEARRFVASVRAG